MGSASGPDDGRQAARSALGFVLLLGIVSLWADATYEGARSVHGPLFDQAQASSLVAGAVAGVGESAAYALRLLTGHLADRWRAYWAFLSVGYVVNLGAVPLLALSQGWAGAALLVVAERAGKGIRGPARDAVLAGAARPLGHGHAFGLHELLDQIGAVAGPLWMALVLSLGLSLRAALATLAFPALLALASLWLAYHWRPPTCTRQTAVPKARAPSLKPFLAAVFFTNLGFVTWALAGFHYSEAGLGASAIGFCYALAMAVDAVMALPLGRAFDRSGPAVLVVVPVAAAAATTFAFAGSSLLWLCATSLAWGLAMAGQETIFKAAVGAVAPTEARARAFGWLHAAQGFGWLVGGLALAALYRAFSPVAACAFALASCSAAAVLFLKFQRSLRG